MYTGLLDTPSFREILTKCGWNFVGVNVGMLLKISESPALSKEEHPELLDISTATSENDHTFFNDITSEAFDIPKIAQSTWKQVNIDVGKDKKCVHLLGSPSGHKDPVTALTMIYTSDGSSYLYNVSTLAKHRKKGYSSALLRHAVRLASKAGCTSMTLCADPKAVNIYSKLGFKPYSELPLYLYGVEFEAVAEKCCVNACEK
eukprot:CAMPEP_0168512600 /NCGR_PEP_ID=MMETSP0405-20121227/2899_1 /TAXON_ID=498012 /ORGANISM="Trichosphaerium sp, Strain Am-I-7 wt" /LENGTH=202 /DNA_ID=CAMNT_0008531143 /DNA_START=145 /DNA_END=753 /DNA_ORIENTATION=+